MPPWTAAPLRVDAPSIGVRHTFTLTGSNGESQALRYFA
jgi:hypothetical protein